ncbi:hypothetical protein TCON_0732 [Astathelohania contejeani]|uniref:Uncharacterized protein n=1 Tax=Astathelohania contejeani TaxID=164912 RepID=A0ABQ7I0R8_9MICR|nr:hypothetical protein TCON_0732 [Thelohania contejeani]
MNSTPQNHLLKILRFPNQPFLPLIEPITSALSLQLFAEPDEPLITICGHNFVIDICDQMVTGISFTTDYWNVNFKYVKYYFNTVLIKKDYLLFYNFLRYFRSFDEEQKGNSQCKGILKTKHGLHYCTCVEYSDSPHLFKDVVREGNIFYNIFTHREEILMDSDKVLLCNEKKIIVNRELENVIKGNELFYNLRADMKPEQVSIQEKVEDKKLEIKNNLDVFVDGELRRDLSFLLKIGKDIEFICKFI